MDLAKKIRERDQVRRAFSRHEQTATSQVDLEFLEDKFKRLEQLDKEIHHELLCKEDFDADKFDEECETCDLYKKKWLVLKTKLQDKTNVQTNKEEHAKKSHNLNLPRLEIRKFDDNPKSWLSFWGQYKKIHEDQSIDAESKFQYLCQAMTPDSKARSLVESYPPTEENYTKVIHTLKERFAKDETLIEIYVRELLKLVNCKNDLTLDLLYDRIVANLQILESLGIIRDKYECILLPMIESALPESTLLSWSKTPRLEGGSKLENLLRFIQMDVEAERRVQLAKIDFLDSSSTNTVPTAACLVNETNQVTRKFGKGQSENEGKVFCYFCDKSHNTLECGKANSLTLEQKKDAIKKKGGCYVCLKRGHLAKNCKVFIKCMCCNRRHLIIFCPVIHDQAKFSGPKTTEKQENPDVSNNFASNNSTTILQTLILKISGKNGDKKVRALLDSGSQRTYVKTSLAQELGLQETGSEKLSHSLFGGMTKATQVHRVYMFQVSDLASNYTITMTGLEQERLCGNLPRVQDEGMLTKLKDHHIYLTDADSSLKTINAIDLLIGSDYLGCILDGNIIHLTEKLVAVSTKLGWTVQGPIEMSKVVYSNIVTSNFVTAVPDNDSLEFLWNMETLGIKDPYEKECDNADFLNITVNEENRYEVGLIWQHDRPQLETNYEQAEKRLWSTTKKLENIKKLEGYHEVLRDWKTEGIIEVVQNDNRNEGHYLPHNAVIKLESATTKIRPVFDASCKDKNKRSLNSCIEKGPNLIEIIPKLLTLFRAGQYGVISDIRKAFLQIAITPTDRKFLKFLWWNDPQTKQQLVTYQHARVPFGVTCSPYLLAATINLHLEKHMDSTYMETAKRLKESFYVDNCVTSFDDKLAVQKFIKEASELMEKGKFELRGWMTNIREEIKETEIVSVLGLQWNRSNDDLCCNLKLKTVPTIITKRSLLSITQQIFDPIGFLCPVTLVPKLIIQKAWLLKTGWDEKIPTELENEYKDWIHTIECLLKCKITRRLSDFPLKDCNISVHLFCDASKDAYAGCIFLRTEYNDKVTVRLIVAKSRVSPIKRQMSLPRLELMGALIASRLYKEVMTSGLLFECKEYEVHCWTDSPVVLAWLQRQNTWKTFVTNRVKEICTNTNKEDWKHLPGIHNPSDLPSRGCDPKSLLETKWWMGPHWLYLKKEEWPKTTVNYTSKEENIINSEHNKSIEVNVDITSKPFSDRLLYFSQFNKIVRLVARLLRMTSNTKKMYNISSTKIGFEEHMHAEKTLIKLIQKENYTEENSMEKNLVTIMEDGIIKVKTRLEYSGQEKDFVKPILLPGKNEIVQRLVREKHEKMNHAGVQILLASLRNTYWITGVRRLVKNVVTKCVICKRYRAKHYVVPEPPLPADRVRCSAAFEVTGIDLAGPLFLKNNKKCWIVLFTCAVYRAVHLELTESLSTNSFLMALRRFIARRGRARIIYTDNGTNFVGAANLLRELNWNEIEEATTCYRIQWKFSVPSAPWWGGWWERLIRILKDMLRRILGKSSLDWIELSTILCDCETVINSRPLTYVEMGDVKPLTPMMFLQSLPTGDTPDLDKIDKNNLQIRYKYLQQLREDFRKRFKNEYLSLLISKGKDDKNEPKIGDLVLIEVEKSRLHWPLGLIIEVYTGKDGFTRVARVQTASGVKVRPYQRLYPLELSSVSQEWLDVIPSPSTTVPRSTDDPGKLPGNEQNSIAPLPLATAITTRSGRAIKVPSRFMY